MNRMGAARVGLMAVLVTTLGACATTPDAFSRQDRFQARTEADQAAANTSVCPVLISNATDRELQASYGQGGSASMLGMLPAGRSVSVRVHCDGGQVEAVGVSSLGGLLSGGYEYRTESRLNRSGYTRLDLKLTDRVR